VYVCLEGGEQERKREEEKEREKGKEYCSYCARPSST
jgi:hypothetical protein